MRIQPPAKILVTGAAGFIGFHVSRKLAELGYEVVGLDNLNDYYDPSLKKDRLNLLTEFANFQFQRGDVADVSDYGSGFDAAIHLAAQAGVRYSIENPGIYIQSNIVGTANLLEWARHAELKHFVYASSSSVYGMNRKLPFSEVDSVDHPISLYAATKKSTELLAHTYSHLFHLPTTGLRFFTVYGPWGRPDMAAFKFTKAILGGESIDVYNEGKMKRDFTYIDDIVQGTINAMQRPAEPDAKWNPEQPTAQSSSAPYRIFNIGNHQSVELMEFIRTLEGAIGKSAQLNLLPMQPGDVPETYADISALSDAVDYAPTTPISVGLPRFVDWYRSYYRV
ncbi:MAG TPA: NAD-dependent epimerase [Fimbriimonadaceae bacterium]|nr:NAD-dependent epimerase [Fimbriimonadaceae bacterium]